MEKKLTESLFLANHGKICVAVDEMIQQVGAAVLPRSAAHSSPTPMLRATLKTRIPMSL
jgi:hypothetical protein